MWDDLVKIMLHRQKKLIIFYFYSIICINYLFSYLHTSFQIFVGNMPRFLRIEKQYILFIRRGVSVNCSSTFFKMLVGP